MNLDLNELMAILYKELGTQGELLVRKISTNSLQLRISMYCNGQIHHYEMRVDLLNPNSEVFIKYFRYAIDHVKRRAT